MIDKIKCPNCAFEFDVEDALAGKLEAQYKADFERKVAEQAAIFNRQKADQEAALIKQLSELETQREEFNKAKARENELFQQRLAKKLEEERSHITKATKEQFEQQLKALEEENEKKKNENRALKQKELDLLKKERELKEQHEEMELLVQKKLFEQQKEIEEKGRAKEREANLLKEKEYQKQLEDQKKLIDEMKRKAEQGSMQLQGEVQELALEELLATAYPFDQIKEVPKGIRGADCIQEVVNNTQQTCGSIVYESKRTKTWGGDWIAKLKQDQVSCKADLAVIVSETLPNDMDRFGNIDGIWVCGFHEVKSLSLVLREMLIRTHAAKSAEENKGDKMTLLYNYFTSNEFMQNISQVMTNYSQMQDQLNAEKRAMQRLWAAREKQIWAVQENLASFIGSVEGITGNELDSGNIMQLPEKDEF